MADDFHGNRGISDGMENFVQQFRRPSTASFAFYLSSDFLGIG